MSQIRDVSFKFQKFPSRRPDPKDLRIKSAKPSDDKTKAPQSGKEQTPTKTKETKKK